MSITYLIGYHSLLRLLLEYVTERREPRGQSWGQLCDCVKDLFAKALSDIWL